jgi:hypothetical protein
MCYQIIKLVGEKYQFGVFNLKSMKIFILTVNHEFFQGGYQILDHSIGKKVFTLTTNKDTKEVFPCHCYIIVWV